MMEKVNWKAVSKRLKELSAERNVALVVPLMQPQDNLVIINITPLDEVRTHKERGGTEKWIRGVLWGWRNRRMSQRSNLVVWSLYDDYREETLLGIGAYVREKTAQRMRERCPHAITLVGNVKEAVLAA